MATGFKRVKHVLFGALALALVACEGGAHGKRLALETPSDQSLVGTWDAKLSLTRPYQLELHEPAIKRICGTIGFVENHYATAATDNSPHMGVYDLNLTLLGLDWLDDRSFPTAVATTVGDSREAASRVSDSVAIVLNPGSAERIVLLGRYDVDGIKGEWTAQSSRGTASGSFSLTPHLNARDQSPRC
jgi:hypothetical protein